MFVGVALTPASAAGSVAVASGSVLVRVEVEPAQPLAGFALVLANGRRIESSWSFSAFELEKLIRVAEG